jgi:hypothetical protein
VGELVLLIVAAAWAAVLLPPLVRSRMENRPNSSITDFNRQLSRLQSSVPQRANTNLRTAGRGLAQAPLERPGSRQHGQVRPTEIANRRPRVHHDPTKPMPRPNRALSNADLVRRRRSNALMALALTSISTLFLAATTKETIMLYLFALSFMALCGFLYLLATVRQREASRWDDQWLKR